MLNTVSSVQDPKVDNWWITLFDPKYQSALAGDLTLLGTLDFSNMDTDIWDAFYDAYMYDPFWTFDEKNKTATIRW